MIVGTLYFPRSWTYQEAREYCRRRGMRIDRGCIWAGWAFLKLREKYFLTAGNV